MKPVFASVCLLESLFCALTKCTVPASEFQLEGDYLIGGLFDIHHVGGLVRHDRPQAIDCSSQSFILSSYRRFQIMRFSVEEINNSSNLLPNVSLGYEIFDHCSRSHTYPVIFNLISTNGSIQPWNEPQRNLYKMSKVMAVVGPFSSSETLTVAPLLMMDLIPLISYGAASSAFSEKVKFPSFLRTVHSNKDIIEVIVNVILHFKWRWVAFLGSDDDFGKDSLELFRKRIKDTEICLPYIKQLMGNANYSQMFTQIEAQKINIIVVFVPRKAAEALMRSVIQLNVTNKVWIAGDTWSLNKKLLEEEGLRNIGTVLGVSQSIVGIPHFDDFIYSTGSQAHCENGGRQTFCSQDYNCSSLRAEDLRSMDPSFSFAVYSATYAVANALHNVLQCGAGKCNRDITVYPYMVTSKQRSESITRILPQGRLHHCFYRCEHKGSNAHLNFVSPRQVLAELRKSNFTLLNQRIQFDENGDPKFGSYSIVFWNNSGHAEEIGFYKFYPSAHFFINHTQIQWYTNGEVPASLCSPECHVGDVKKQVGSHKCCFTCKICPKGTYVNSTEDAYKCVNCKETEWSAEGSTSCNLRLVEYIPFTDSSAILIMLGAWAFVGITLAVSVLFALNYNTPVVRSAGGPMCFLILGCLSLSCVSVFFYFDKPTVPFCVMRMLPFMLFYTVCLACFVVRSFQIVCIFKIAAKFPKLHGWWMKYHGQWLVIAVLFGTQALLLLIGYSHGPPQPYNETVWYPDKIILCCDFNLSVNSCSVILVASLCALCFIFSYMGKDLPKNYNEAKAITFCLLLLILTWIIVVTQLMLDRGKKMMTLTAAAILSSLYSFLLWYFLPKCYIILFQPEKNTQQYFQGLIQTYTKTISQ